MTKKAPAPGRRTLQLSHRYILGYRPGMQDFLSSFMMCMFDGVCEDVDDGCEDV